MSTPSPEKDLTRPMPERDATRAALTDLESRPGHRPHDAADWKQWRKG